MSSQDAPTRPTVLAVNDEPEMLEVLSRLLKHEGYEVVCLLDGRHALETARRISPDIIISDVVMPLMDGVELCRQLKKDELTASVPVLLVSGRSTADADHISGLRAGADDYLELPFRRHELIVKVARLVERREAERRLSASVKQLEALSAALSEQAEREALINRITRAVRRSLDPAEVFRTAVNELGLHLGVDRCVLFMLDRDAGVARAVAEYVTEGVLPAGREYSIPLIRRLIEQVSEHGVLTFNDVATDERIREVYENVLRPLGTRSIMYAAIRVGADTPAAFAISTTRTARSWRDSDTALARAVADQTGIAIRQAELFEQVMRAKQNWEATFDAMSDGIFIFDNSCSLIRVNRAGAALEGESPSALMGRRCCDILRSGGGDSCVVEQAVKEGQAITLELTPERLGRPLLVTAEPVREAQGAPAVGTVCTVRDLSELRKVERVARERQSLLESILESAREAIYAIDPQGHIQWINGATTAMSGYLPEQLIGRHVLDVTYEANRADVEEHLRLALAGEAQSYETRYVAFDGSTRHARIENAPLIIDGRITGVLGIARDITEQKQERERAVQADKLRALGQLASGVAHDFNNALAAILGRAQLLRRMKIDPLVAQSLDIIETAAEDAASTVRRIRTFARQSHTEQFEQLEVSALLRDAVEITRTRWENEAHASGLRYSVRLDAEAGLYTEGNASDLREVFVNLIVNAVDAMPLGGELSIRAEGDAERVRLSFKDDGTGMSDEVRHRIFEPFYSTKGLQGTGLGLFVSYGIIERHQGSMSVESEQGRGATFRIELPRIEPTHTPTSTSAHATVAPPLCILVVDDEAFVRDTLVEMLRALGHSVEAAEGGRAALKALAAREFDMVFTDLSMPEMDGWEVAREIRRRWPQICVVIVTGHGRETAAPTDKTTLVDGIIGKPFNFEQVEETILSLMERKKAKGNG